MRKLVKNVLAMLIVGGTAVVMGNGTASASNGIGINEQNFQDAQIRQIATQYDSNKDQILDTSEQKKLTELIVIETTENTGVQGNVIRTAKGITSFKGVEYFAELKSISVGQSGKPQSSYKIASDLFQYAKQVKTIRVNYAYADPVDAKYKDYVYEPASSNYKILQNTSVKVLDLSRLTKVKHAKTTLKKAFLKNKNVKKVVISKKLSKHDKVWLQKKIS